MRRALIAAVVALGACGQAGVVQGPIGQIDDSYRIAPASLPALFDCLRENDQTVVSAHRGGWTPGMPENAISTFENAVARAPVFLEIDVRAARDGLVVMHDDTADRTTRGRGALADMTVAQITALQLRGASGQPLDDHPPSFRQALDWADGRTVLELDIKQDVRFEEVIAEVRAADAMGRVVFITNSVGAAARLARLAPEAMLYVTVRNVRDLDELERRGVDLAHVVAWTGDDEPDRALNIALAERGVEARFGMFGRDAPSNQAAAFADTGLQIIATDAPDAVVANLDEHDGDASGYRALQCVAAD